MTLKELDLRAPGVIITIKGVIDEVSVKYPRRYKVRQLDDIEFFLTESGWSWKSEPDTTLMALARISYATLQKTREILEQLDDVLSYKQFLRWLKQNSDLNEALKHLAYVVTGDNLVWEGYDTPHMAGFISNVRDFVRENLGEYADEFDIFVDVDLEALENRLFKNLKEDLENFITSVASFSEFADVLNSEFPPYDVEDWEEVLAQNSDLVPVSLEVKDADLSELFEEKFGTSWFEMPVPSLRSELGKILKMMKEVEE